MAGNESFIKPVSSGESGSVSWSVGIVGDDVFWSMVKEAKRLRREKQWDRSIAEFRRAIDRASTAGVGAASLETEIARTLWHAGRAEDAVDAATALLPDESAASLIASIYREEYKGAERQGLSELALDRLELLCVLQKRLRLPLLTEADMKSLNRLSSLVGRKVPKVVSSDEIRTSIARRRVKENLARLRKSGMEYVMLVGVASDDPWSAYLGKTYYIGKGDDPLGTYPRLDSTPNAFGGWGPPYQIGCVMSVAPVVLEMADSDSLERGRPDELSLGVARLGTHTEEARSYFVENDGPAVVAARMQAQVEAIRNRARLNGYEPPPWSPNGDVA